MYVKKTAIICYNNTDTHLNTLFIKIVLYIFKSEEFEWKIKQRSYH